jgi:hypothetical protein
MTKLLKVIIRNRNRSSACHWLEMWYSVESTAHVDIWTRTSDRHLSYKTEQGPNTRTTNCTSPQWSNNCTSQLSQFYDTLHIIWRPSLRQGRETEHLPPPSSEVKNEYSYIIYSLYVPFRRGPGQLYCYLILTYHISQKVTAQKPSREVDHIHHLNHS